LVEIKCPFKGRESTLWKSVQDRRLPEHNQWQVQHQLMVTKADIADVYIFDGSVKVVFPVAPDESAWPRICSAWEAFARFVAEAQAPPLTDRDTRIRDDPEWLSAAAAYLAAKRAADTVAKAFDEAKSQLVGLAAHAREQGGGVSVSRFWKKGAVEYKRVPELASVDLEQYRCALRLLATRFLANFRACGNAPAHKSRRP